MTFILLINIISIQESEPRQEKFPHTFKDTCQIFTTHTFQHIGI